MASRTCGETFGNKDPLKSRYVGASAGIMGDNLGGSCEKEVEEESLSSFVVSFDGAREIASPLMPPSKN